MKISNDLKERYHTNYTDATEFASAARLLQSIWREENGLSCGRYGNYLKEKVTENIGKNFLTNRIFELVKTEIDKKRESGKVIQEPRIWTNLLSSQPMAFNMFGEFVFNLDLCGKVFEELYPERDLKKVTRIEFEYSPARKSKKYTSDNSAFDVFVEYINTRDEKCFFGIEVKYAETLNDKPSSHKKEYEDVAEESRVFNLDKLSYLKEKPIQQIWRDHLLALSMFVKNDDYKVGDFIYLYPVNNENCKVGIEKYTETFNENIEPYFKPLTFEKLVSVTKQHCSDNWIAAFEDRYLNFDKIKTTNL